MTEEQPGDESRQHLESCLTVRKRRSFGDPVSFERQAQLAYDELLALGALLFPAGDEQRRRVAEHAQWLVDRDPVASAQLQERAQGLDDLEGDDEAWLLEYNRRSEEWLDSEFARLRRKR